MYIEDKEKSRAGKLKVILYLLLAVSFIMGIIFFFTNKGANDSTMVSTLLNWAYILLFVGIVAAILLPIFFRGGKIHRGHASDKSKVGIFIVGGFVLCCIIAYLLAPGTAVPLSQSVDPPSHSTLVMTDTVLILAIILLVVAVLFAVFGSIFKRRS